MNCLLTYVDHYEELAYCRPIYVRTTPLCPVLAYHYRNGATYPVSYASFLACTNISYTCIAPIAGILDHGGSLQLYEVA